MNHRIQADVSGRIGLVGLALFSLLAFTSPIGISLGSILMLAALMLEREYWAQLATPSVMLSLVFAIYVLVRGGLAMHAFPAHDDIPRHMLGWLGLAFWFVPAFWISRVEGRDRYMLLLALTGLLAGSFVGAYEHGVTIFTAGRDDFRIRPISLSLYCSFLLFAIWIYLPDQWHRLKAFPAWMRGLLAVGAVLCTGVLVQILIRGQSRGSWLAVLISTLVLIGWSWRRYRSSVSLRLRAGIVAFLVAVGAGLVMVNSDFILRKLTFENHVAQAVYSDGLDAAPVSSMTHRLALWAFAIETIPQHVFFGVGPAVGEYLMADSEDPKLQSPQNSYEPFDHFHNFYLQALMDLGIVGFVLFVAMVAAALREAVRNVRHGGGDKVRLVFAGIALLTTAIWSLFDFRAVHWDWRGYWYLLMSTVFYISVQRSRADS